MVRKGSFEGKDAYFCGDCGFGYLSEETAEKCEEWCTTYRSCSMDITKDAITKG